MTHSTLTNELSKVFYTQYGVNKMLCYNGPVDAAKKYLRSTTGIKTTIAFCSYKIDGFLPVGYASIETV